MAFKDEVLLDTWDKSKYCIFHQNHGHATKNCKALQQEIEAFIKTCFLSTYVGHDKCLKNDRDRIKVLKAKDNSQPTVGIVNIIIVGIAS